MPGLGSSVLFLATLLGFFSLFPQVTSLVLKPKPLPTEHAIPCHAVFQTEKLPEATLTSCKMTHRL